MILTKLRPLSVRGPLLCSLLLGFAACGGDAESGGSETVNPNADASIHSDTDAGTGSDSVGATDDAGASTSTGDAAAPQRDPEVKKEPFSVEVLMNGVPVKGVQVLFHDEAGSLLDAQFTNENGAVFGDTAPSMVTVNPSVFDGKTALVASVLGVPVTYVGVAKDDHLVMDISRNSEANHGSYEVTLDAKGAASASEYVVARGSCASGTTDLTTPLSLAVTNECLGGRNGVLAYATAGSEQDGTIDTVAFAYSKSNETPSAGTNLPITLGAFQAPSIIDLQVESAPDAFTLGADLRITAGGRYFPPSPYVGQYFLATDGHTDQPYPKGFADALEANVYATNFSEAPYSSLSFVRRMPDSDSAVFDFGTALPQITSASMTGETTQRPVVEWTSEAAQNDGDVAIVLLAWNGQQDGKSYIYPWIIVAPATTTKVTFPELAEARDTPSAMLMSVTIADQSDLDGYTAFKQRELTQLGDGVLYLPNLPDVPLRMPLDATTGEVRASQLALRYLRQ